MNILKKTISFLNHKGALNFLPDKQYLELIYWQKFGKRLDLNNPKTFNEKLQWIKLNDRRPEYSMLVDKYEVKKIVASKIGEEYIIPTLGIWDSFEQIDFDSLPNQFVLKCTHDSGGNVICKDKSSLDISAAKEKINRSLRTNYYYQGREWPYKNVKPRIIAEQYMEDKSTGNLTDFKVHCFNGVPKVILVCRDRFGEMTEDFFSETWEHLSMARDEHPNALAKLERPSQLTEMLALAEKLSEEFLFIRTDFYTINNSIYFGELTFFPASGLKPFSTKEPDETLEDWLTIPLGGGKTLIKKQNMFILLEPEDSISTGLTDYKFFCFNGKVKCFKIDFDRYISHRANYYNTDGQLLPFGEELYPPDAKRDIKLPANLRKMIELAEILGRDTKFIRVDFYETNNKVFFGELTFFPASGLGRFTPNSWDEILGSWLRLGKRSIMT